VDRKRVSRDQPDASSKKEYMQDAKEVFARTQTWLKAHTYDATRQNYPAYANLVAAHAYMVAQARRHVKGFIAEDRRSDDQRSMREAYDILPDPHGTRFNYEVYEIGKHYGEHLHHDERGIYAYLAENYTSVSAGESEAAWWVMQLRGMAWHFSTWHGGTMVRDVLGEQFILSSFTEIRARRGLFDLRSSLLRVEFYSLATYMLQLRRCKLVFHIRYRVHSRYLDYSQISLCVHRLILR
jgi:hypothetical protein